MNKFFRFIWFCLNNTILENERKEYHLFWILKLHKKLISSIITEKFLWTFYYCSLVHNLKIERKMIEAIEFLIQKILNIHYFFWINTFMLNFQCLKSFLMIKHHNSDYFISNETIETRWKIFKNSVLFQ
jgi:hypothetical protein